MDTRDLKNLLQEQSSVTSLTPQSVWYYTRVRRRARQRVATVAAVLALTVGTGLGAVYLNSLSREQRPEIATVPSTPEGAGATQSATEPTPVEESSAASEQPTEPVEPVEPDPGDEHPDETPPKPGPEPKCVLPMPKSWLDAFEAEPAELKDETVEFLDRGTRLKLVKDEDEGMIGSLSLVDPNGEIPIDQRVDTNHSGPLTDGRFVVYVRPGNELMVWDQKTRGASKPVEVKVPDGQDFAFSLTNGQLWVTTGKTTPNSGDPVFREASLYSVNLNSGTSAERVLQGEKFEPLRSLDGRGQVRFMDDRKVRFVDPDGTTEPVVKAYPDLEADGRSGQVLSLYDGSEVGAILLYHSGWDEAVEVSGTWDGTYGGTAGMWSIVDTNQLYHIPTQAMIEESDKTHIYTVTPLAKGGEDMLNQIRLFENTSKPAVIKSIPLSQLPQEDFTCK